MHSMVFPIRHSDLTYPRHCACKCASPAGPSLPPVEIESTSKTAIAEVPRANCALTVCPSLAAPVLHAAPAAERPPSPTFAPIISPPVLPRPASPDTGKRARVVYEASSGPESGMLFPASSKVARASAPSNRVVHALQLDGATMVLPQTGPQSSRAALQSREAKLVDGPTCIASTVPMTTIVAVSSAACSGEEGLPAHARPALSGPRAGAPVHEAPLPSPLRGAGQPPDDDLSWIWNPGDES